MAIVNHVRTALSINQVSVSWRGVWLLTRALKKAGWKYKASSNGTTKDTTGDPALDKWTVSSTATNTGGAVASIAAPTRGRSTITGLTGIVSADKGRFVTFSGAATGANNNRHQIEEILSATSVRIDARQFVVASDANNGAITWSITDPMQELFSAYAAPTAVGWWTAQGPSVLKIPITAASTGTFKRGENITQASTGAEGELVGYTYRNAVGWLVIAPRLRGTGAGAHGWDTANVITGAKSGATVTQVGTAIDYVYEYLFVKPAAQNVMQLFCSQVDKAAESAELFSVLATSAGCTAAVHPGGGGTGNAFPTHAWVTWGTGTAPGSGSNLLTTGDPTCLNAIIMCVDAIPETAYSADGSFSLCLSTHYNTSTSNKQVGGPLYGLHRLNDTEDGEVSLYASISNLGIGKVFGNPNRLSAGTAPIATFETTGSFYEQDTRFPSVSNATAMYAGWRARGLPLEAFTEFAVLALKLSQTSYGSPIGYPMGGTNVPAIYQAANARPFTRVREKIWLTGQGTRQYKGSIRWASWVSGGNYCDIYGTDPGWFQIADAGAINTFSAGGAMIVGPHDGAAPSVQPF